MSILKAIFHRYNSQSKSYDTMHPETEVAQITDFGNGVVNTLIGTALASTISAVTSNSVFGKCVQLVLNASGVKYSMAQNGYICLGSFFGNLIIQWGLWAGNDARYVAQYADITYPISFTQRTIAVVATDCYSSDDYEGSGVILGVTQPHITKTGCRIIGTLDVLDTFHVIIIGQ